MHAWLCPGTPPIEARGRPRRASECLVNMHIHLYIRTYTHSYIQTHTYIHTCIQENENRKTKPAIQINEDENKATKRVVGASQSCMYICSYVWYDYMVCVSQCRTAAG